MNEPLTIKIRKIQQLLEQPLQADTRRIWRQHLRALEDKIEEKERERRLALARLGGAYLET